MASCRIKLDDGETVNVSHQFGTVRRKLDLAATRAADDKGQVTAFAEFHADTGRVLVNPDKVVTVAQVGSDE